MGQKKESSRRDFFKQAFVGLGAIAIGSCSASHGRAGEGVVLKLDLTRAENEPLKTVGGMLALDDNELDSKGLLIYRAGENEFRVLSRRCTHWGCQIDPFKDGIATCPCHDAQFDLAGKVVEGPADEPLKTYRAVLKENRLIISEKMKNG